MNVTIQYSGDRAKTRGVHALFVELLKKAGLQSADAKLTVTAGAKGSSEKHGIAGISIVSHEIKTTLKLCFQPEGPSSARYGFLSVKGVTKNDLQAKLEAAIALAGEGTPHKARKRKTPEAVVAILIAEFNKSGREHWEAAFDLIEAAAQVMTIVVGLGQYRHEVRHGDFHDLLDDATEVCSFFQVLHSVGLADNVDCGEGVNGEKPMRIDLDFYHEVAAEFAKRKAADQPKPDDNPAPTNTAPPEEPTPTISYVAFLYRLFQVERFQDMTTAEVWRDHGTQLGAVNGTNVRNHFKSGVQNGLLIPTGEERQIPPQNKNCTVRKFNPASEMVQGWARELGVEIPKVAVLPPKEELPAQDKPIRERIVVLELRKERHLADVHNLDAEVQSLTQAIQNIEAAKQEALAEFARQTTEREEMIRLRMSLRAPLLEEIPKLQTQISALQAQDESAIFAALEETARRLGIPVDQLLAAGMKRVAPAAQVPAG